MCRVINTAHSRANFILRAFSYSNSSTRCKLFCTLVRPLLEYCSQIWLHYKLENIDIIEGVPRSFTHRLPGLSSLSYSDRLIKTNFSTLELRRLRADFTLLYNILHNNLYISRNKFVLRSNVVLSSVNTRGHSLRLFISHVNLNVVKYAFFHRTAMLWNTLEDYIISAPNYKIFNARLLDTYLVRVRFFHCTYI